MTRGHVPAAVNRAAVAMFSLFVSACTMKDSAPADSTKAAEGMLRADSATYGFTLWAVVVILGLLMFMPVAVLGPIAEYLALR